MGYHNIKKRVSVICETPYNVFNTIRFFYSKKECVDIYISCNLNYLKEKLDIVGIFENVYIFDNYIKENKSIFIKHLLLKREVEKSIPCQCRKMLYSQIYVFSVTEFVADFIYYNPKADIYFIEDGMDSYIGRIIPSFSRKEKLSCWLFRRDWNRLIPKVVYLNEPRMCLEDKYESRMLFDDLNNDSYLKVLLKDIFEYKDTELYSRPSVVYLGQAFVADKMGDGIEKVEEIISKFLFDNDISTIFRKHPREIVFSKYWKHIDYGDNNWELICENQIDGRFILISPFSTALLTPKLIFGKEPYIIYTYKLYNEYFLESNQMTAGLNYGISNVISMLKNIYEKPDKVICVESIEELFYIINQILGGENDV